jgi:hypothetical protein
MIKELKAAILAVDLPEYGLKAGDIGTVVLVHRGGEGYEVEFMTLDGDTIDVVVVEAARLRPVSADDVPHTRPLSLPRPSSD